MKNYKYNNLIYVINGPNLGDLGHRTPEIYGKTDLASLNFKIYKYCEKKNLKAVFFQSNHEGDIIDTIYEAAASSIGIILNPGAFAHYSYAIRDAIEAIDIPVIEVHISDINNRESFRKTMVLNDVCYESIIGRGTQGYFDAIDVLTN